MSDHTGPSHADRTLPGKTSPRVCDGLGADLSGNVLLVLAERGAGLAGICAWQGKWETLSVFVLSRPVHSGP